MADSDPNTVRMGSDDIPEVVTTLASLLPQFKGADLEAQLQTFDVFLGILSPAAREKIANLIASAAEKMPTSPKRARIAAAAESVRTGGRAAEPYDHAKATESYQQTFRNEYPIRTVPKAATPAATPAGAGGTHPDILAKLDEIEAELKRIGRWSDHPPADFVAKVERGELQSFLEAPTFELWLQVLLLPRARRAAIDDQLPETSQVGEMARRQYNYMSIDYDAETLLRLLGEFDDLVVATHSRHE